MISAELSIAFIIGVLLGGCYFGGLWWTVRRLPNSPHVWRLYFGSLLLRLSLALSTFLLVLTRLEWIALAACLLGFVASRLALIQLLGTAPPIVSNERVSP